MKFEEIVEKTSADVLFRSDQCRDREIEHAVAADLMSEVMVGTVDDSLIITGLINAQVVRTAEMMNVCAVLFVRGKDVPEAIVDLAKDRDVTVMRTNLTMFEVCGILYEAGMASGQPPVGA